MVNAIFDALNVSVLIWIKQKISCQKCKVSTECKKSTTSNVFFPFWYICFCPTL